MESISLFRDGQFFYATAYISSSVVFGIIATFIGFAIKLLRIFIGESDKHGQHPLYEEIVFEAKKQGVPQNS